MDKARRKSYLMTYYKWPAIFFVIGLVLFAWFVKDTFFQPEPVSMGCAFGVTLTEEEKTLLTDGYLEYYGHDPKKNVAVVATDNMFEGTAQQMDANGNQMALFAQIAAGEIYYLILDDYLLELYSNGGVYCGLNEVLPKDVVQKLVDSGCTRQLTDPDTGEVYEAAIDLKSIGFLTKEDPDGYLIYTIARPDEGYPLRLYEYLVDCGQGR